MLHTDEQDRAKRSVEELKMKFRGSDKRFAMCLVSPVESKQLTNFLCRVRRC